MWSNQLTTKTAGNRIKTATNEMKKRLFVGIGITAIILALLSFTIVGLRCYKCNGKGTIEVKKDCPTCNGQGKDKWGDNCYRCDGKGYVYESETCPECNGTGEQTKPVPFPEPNK